MGNKKRGVVKQIYVLGIYPNKFSKTTTIDI